MYIISNPKAAEVLYPATARLHPVVSTSATFIFKIQNVQKNIV